MNFKSRKCEENGKKVLRYSIRKHHLGVASVAVASVLFFATGVTTVQADGPAAGTAGSASTPGSTSTPDSPPAEQPTEPGKPLDEEIEEKERKEEEERRQHKGEFFEKDSPSLEKNTNTEDTDANRVYKEPKEGTSAKGLYKVLDSLPDDFQNNELNYLKNMDAIGDKIGLKSGEIRELGLTLEKINKLGLTPEKLEQLGVEPSLIKKSNLMLYFLFHSKYIL